MSADLGSLATALGLPEVPDLGKVRAKLLLPGHTRDEVRKVILDVYKEIDLDTSLPSHSAASVRATLAQWARWVAGLPRAGDGTIDPVNVDGTVIRALRQQGEVRARRDEPGGRRGGLGRRKIRELSDPALR